MSSYEERLQAEKGCQIELSKRKIGGTAEFRKWAVRNHPDKGGKLRVFQKVSGCVDLMYKASDGDSPRASTSYASPSSRPPGRKTKSRASSSGPRSETFWSAFEEFEIDEDILYGRAGPNRRREREREQHYERAYGFRGSSPMPDDVTFESWDEFEAYVQNHMAGRERAARAEEQKAKERRRARRRKADAERKDAEAERKRNGTEGNGSGTERKGRPGWRGASPENWQGPANPYQAPGAPNQSGPRSPHEQSARERGRAAAQEALQRLRQTFRFEGDWREPGLSGDATWRHRISRPQVAFMVAQLTCMQSVFLSTAFPRF